MPTRVKRQVALPQAHAVAPFDCYIAVQDGRLKFQDIAAHPFDRPQELGRGGTMGGEQLGGRHPDRIGRQRRLVDACRIVQHGRQADRTHVAANALDHLGRRESLAKHFRRAALASLADHVAAGAEPLAQSRQRRAKIVAARIELRHPDTILAHGADSRRLAKSQL